MVTINILESPAHICIPYSRPTDKWWLLYLTLLSGSQKLSHSWALLNTDNFVQNTHNRHPIAQLSWQAMGCLLMNVLQNWPSYNENVLYYIWDCHFVLWTNGMLIPTSPPIPPIPPNSIIHPTPPSHSQQRYTNKTHIRALNKRWWSYMKCNVSNMRW